MDASAVAEEWPTVAGKVLPREFRTIADRRPEHGHDDTESAHLTASENLHHGPETMAEASMALNRKSFVDKACGINARDNGRSGRPVSVSHVFRVFCAWFSSDRCLIQGGRCTVRGARFVSQPCEGAQKGVGRHDGVAQDAVGRAWPI